MLDAVGSWIRSPEDELRVSIARAVDEPTNAYNALWSLVRARRPAAALEYYARRDTTGVWAREWQAWDHFAAQAYHMMGRFEEELALVRAAKAREPRYFAHWAREVGALAALGRVDEIERLITEGHGLETPGAAVRLMEAAAVELAKHDRADQASGFAQRVLAGEAQWPDSLRASVAAGNLRRSSLRILGRHAEVVHDLEEWERRTGSAGLAYRILAARDRILTGDTAGALALADSARTQPLIAYAGSGWAQRGRPMYFGAHILALLGRRDEAVALLREALNNGARLGPGEPLEWYWAPISDYPPFQELVRIR